MESSLNSSRLAPYYYEYRFTRSFYLAPQRTSFRLEGVLNTPFFPEYAIVGILDRQLYELYVCSMFHIYMFTTVLLFFSYSNELKGSYQFSNYTFKNYALSQLYFESAGVKYPTRPYSPDWTSNTNGYIHEYLGFMGGNGQSSSCLKTNYKLGRIRKTFWL